MKHSLPVVLRKKMLEKQISAHRLEQEAGLKRSAVQNILHGRSKKPSAEILQAVAKVLDCSISDLLADKTSMEPELMSSLKHLSPNEMPMNFKLFISASEFAETILNDKKDLLSKNKALDYINEIYQYSVDNGIKTIDSRYASWLAQKWWNIKF